MKYTLPKVKKESQVRLEVPIGGSYAQHINFPVSKEMLKQYAIGDSCEIILKGKISSLDSRSSIDYERNEMTIELASVETEETNEYSQMAKDEETED